MLLVSGVRPQATKRAGNLSSGQTISSQGYVSNSNGSSAKGGSTNVYLDTNDTFKLITETSGVGRRC